MPDRSQHELIATVSSEFQGQLIAGALGSEGIITHVEHDDHLMDEFAMAQKLMSLQGTRVYVLKADAEKARAILAKLPKADGETMPWDAPHPDREVS